MSGLERERLFRLLEVFAVETHDRAVADILDPMRYTAIFEVQPDGGYHVMCPTLQGCHSEGDTLEEADANIREAIAVYLESLRAHGEELPVEDILIKPLDVAVAP